MFHFSSRLISWLGRRSGQRRTEDYKLLIGRDWQRSTLWAKSFTEHGQVSQPGQVYIGDSVPPTFPLLQCGAPLPKGGSTLLGALGGRTQVWQVHGSSKVLHLWDCTGRKGLGNIPPIVNSPDQFAPNSWAVIFSLCFAYFQPSFLLLWYK